MADGFSSLAPLVATITGSTTNGGRLPFEKKSATARMISSEYNIPDFTAFGGNSSNTA
jgi:hypothetical protein